MERGWVTSSQTAGAPRPGRRRGAARSRDDMHVGSARRRTARDQGLQRQAQEGDGHRQPRWRWRRQGTPRPVVWACAERRPGRVGRRREKDRFCSAVAFRWLRVRDDALPGVTEVGTDLLRRIGIVRSAMGRRQVRVGVARCGVRQPVLATRSGGLNHRPHETGIGPARKHREQPHEQQRRRNAAGLVEADQRTHGTRATDPQRPVAFSLGRTVAERLTQGKVECRQLRGHPRQLPGPAAAPRRARCGPPAITSRARWRSRHSCCRPSRPGTSPCRRPSPC